MAGRIAAVKFETETIAYLPESRPNNWHKLAILIISCTVIVCILIMVGIVRLEAVVREETRPRSEPGWRGSHGPIGRTKPLGAAGPQGEPGLDGPTGPKRQTGPRGPKGQTGPTGAAGPPGEPGLQGPTGPEGQTGEPGPPGPAGSQGAPGLQGPTGPKRQTGSPGPAGSPGEPALPGSPRPKGKNSSDEQVGPPNQRNICGGRYEILLPTQELAYELQPLDQNVSCLWVVTAKQFEFVTITLLELSVLDSNTDFSLEIFQILQADGCTSSRMRMRPNSSVNVDNQIFYILFSGRTSVPGQGFRLMMVAGGVFGPWELSFVNQPHSFVYKYPPSPQTYYNNSANFVLVGTPPIGSRANVSVYRIDTEARCDIITLLYVDPNLPRRYNCERRSGKSVENILASVPSGMPFIVYFSSDVDTTGRGFRVQGEWKSFGWYDPQAVEILLQKL